MKTTRTALRALSFSYANARSIHSRRTTMKKFNTFCSVGALLGASACLTACGMEDNPEEPLGVSLTVTAKAPECAAEVGAPNCSTIEICVQHVLNPAEAVNATLTGTCIPLSLTSGEATGTFVSLPEPGPYSVGFKNLPEGFYVKYTMGGFETDDVLELNQGSNSLNVVLGTDGTGPNTNGPGNFTIGAVNGNGDPVQNCGFNYNSDHLDATCTVNADGATCNNIASDNSYTVDVSCLDGTLVYIGYLFAVIPGVTTHYTVIVAPPGSTGSGLGEICVDVTNANEDDCVFTVDGQPVTPDADANNICEGALLADQPAKTVEIKAVCGESEGSITTEVVEDGVTNVGLTVEDTSVTQPDPTEFCLHIGIANGDPVDLAHCVVTDIAWKVMTPVAHPIGVCEATDALYFADAKPGDRQIQVECDEGNKLAFFDIVANSFNEKDVLFSAPSGLADEACYFDVGDHVDTIDMGLALQVKLGHLVDTQNGPVCAPESNSSSYAGWTVTAITDNGDCTALGDPDCLIAPRGLVSDPLVSGQWYAHLYWETTPEKLATLPVDPQDPDAAKRTHFITLDDGNGKTVIVPVVVKNGVVQHE